MKRRSIIDDSTTTKPKVKRQAIAEGKKCKDREGREESLEGTGARPGEFIIGVAKLTKGAILKIKSGSIPARGFILDRMMSTAQQWSKHCDYLRRSSTFFSSMSSDDIKSYLQMHQQKKEIGIEEIKDLVIEVVTLGNSSLAQLSDEDHLNMSSVLDGSPIHASAFIKQIPSKTDASAKQKARPSLFGLTSFWKLERFSPIIDRDSIHGQRSIILCNIFTGQAQEYKSVTELECHECKWLSTNIGQKQILFCQCRYNTYPNENARLNEEAWSNEALLAMASSITKSDVSVPFLMLEKAGASLLKSLLQKVIRFRPTVVSIPQTGEAKDEFSFPAESVLLAVVIRLFKHKQVFIPSVHRLVRGLESAIKRSVIIAFEDSSAKPEDILRMTMLALLAQRVYFWIPDTVTVKFIFEFILGLYNESRFYDHTKVEAMADALMVKNGSTAKKGSGTTLDYVSWFISSIGSFESDCTMIRNIASIGDKGPLAVSGERCKAAIMPIYHAIDQHVYPNILYLVGEEPFRKQHVLPVAGLKPFQPLFAMLFNRVTGVNSRTSTFNEDEFRKDEFVIAVKCAQRLVWQAQM